MLSQQNKFKVASKAYLSRMLHLGSLRSKKKIDMNLIRNLDNRGKIKRRTFRRITGISLKEELQINK